MKTIRISYYLTQPLNRFKGNKSVGKSGKVSQAIQYRNELDSEKQAITQGEKVHSPPGDQVWKKDKSKHPGDGDM